MTILTDIKSKIIIQLMSADQSIDLMLAWFTDPELIDAVEAVAKKKGRKVRIILSNSDWNYRQYYKLKALSDNWNVEIRSKGAKTTDTSELFMHRKLAIIDAHTVMNGSYNWSKGAAKNDEDLTITEDAINAISILERFEADWLISEDFFAKAKPEEAEKLSKEIEELELQGMEPLQFHGMDFKPTTEPKEIVETATVITSTELVAPEIPTVIAEDMGASEIAVKPTFSEFVSLKDMLQFTKHGSYLTDEGKDTLKSVIDYAQEAENKVSIELDGRQLGGIWSLRKDAVNVYIQFNLLKDIFPYKTIEFQIQQAQFISFLKLSRVVFNELNTPEEINKFIEGTSTVTSTINSFNGTRRIKEWLGFEGIVMLNFGKNPRFTLRLQDDHGDFTCKPHN